MDDDEMVVEILRLHLEHRGFEVVTAATGAESLERLRSDLPDLVVCDINMPGMDGLALVRRLRADPATSLLPLIFLSARDSAEDASAGLRLGADDYVRKPVHPEELAARISARLERPAVPVTDLLWDRHAGVLREERFLDEVDREASRAAMSKREGWVAVVDVAERETVRRRFGERGEAAFFAAIAAKLKLGTGPLERIGRSSDGRLLVVMPEVSGSVARNSLRRFAVGVASTQVEVSGEWLSATPVIGYASLLSSDSTRRRAQVVLSNAVSAQEVANGDLDLRPVRWSPAFAHSPAPEGHRDHRRPRRERFTIVAQLLATFVAGILLPFGVYLGAYQLGFDISPVMYVAVVIALVATALLIWIEGFLAFDPQRPPEAPPMAPPRASAVIAAFLPNEAATIVETVESFLRVDYPDLEVVLAYNTPQSLPVEAALDAIAARDARFTPLRVFGSTSKAQNINAALQHVTGEFIGIFDADHQPDPDAFRRAWRWIAAGYDVVQGHCVIRNGSATKVSRTVAVEFESIYAVSHPGRVKLHGFGVFGGSNGYWKASTLRSTRMFGSMLTEDIDSSLRLVLAGGRIANDPALISRELAPTTLSQLWNQRMRWAQGWFQVSLRHLLHGLVSRHLTLQQKFGFFFLLAWREMYVWLSMQIIPLLMFLAWRDGGVGNLQWLISVLVLSTLFTFSVGPGQVLFAWRLAVPEVRRQHRWFLAYLLWACTLYSEWKNIISRIAQVKEAVGERVWRVTPRGTELAGAERKQP